MLLLILIAFVCIAHTENNIKYPVPKDINHLNPSPAGYKTIESYYITEKNIKYP